MRFAGDLWDLARQGQSVGFQTLPVRPSTPAPRYGTLEIGPDTPAPRYETLVDSPEDRAARWALDDAERAERERTERDIERGFRNVALRSAF